jgi:hypothetical protein
MDAIIKQLLLKDMKARLIILNAKDEVIGAAPWVGVAAVKQWIDIIERQA